MSQRHLDEDSLMVVLTKQPGHQYHPGDQVVGDVYLNLAQPLEVVDVELKIWGRDKTTWKTSGADTRKHGKHRRDCSCDVEFYGHGNLFKSIYRLIARADVPTEQESPMSSYDKPLVNAGSFALDARSPSSKSDKKRTIDAAAGSNETDTEIAAKESRHTLSAGQHRWRFAFCLPDNSPSTFNFAKGSHRANVRYKVKAIVVPSQRVAQRAPPMGVTDELIVTSLPSISFPLSKSHGAMLQQNCRAGSDVNVSLAMPSSNLIAGEDVTLSAEVNFGVFRVRSMVIQLRQKLTLKSSSRKKVVLDSIAFSRTLKFPPDADKADLCAVDREGRKLQRSLHVTIPRGAAPTSSGPLISAEWYFLLQTNVGSGSLLGQGSTSVNVTLPVAIHAMDSSLKTEDVTQRLVPYGFNTVADSPPILMTLPSSTKVPDEAAAKAEPPYFTARTTRPERREVAPRPKTKEPEWMEPNGDSSDKQKYRWVDGSEEDSFPTEMWGEAADETVDFGIIEVVRGKQDLALRRFDDGKGGMLHLKKFTQHPSKVRG